MKTKIIAFKILKEVFTYFELKGHSISSKRWKDIGPSPPLLQWPPGTLHLAQLHMALFPLPALLVAKYSTTCCSCSSISSSFFFLMLLPFLLPFFFLFYLFLCSFSFPLLLLFLLFLPSSSFSIFLWSSFLQVLTGSYYGAMMLIWNWESSCLCLSIAAIIGVCDHLPLVSIWLKSLVQVVLRALDAPSSLTKLVMW